MLVATKKRADMYHLSEPFELAIVLNRFIARNTQRKCITTGISQLLPG